MQKWSRNKWKIAKAQVQLFNSSERINLKNTADLNVQQNNLNTLESKVDHINEYMRRRSTIANSKQDYYGLDIIQNTEEAKIIEEPSEIIKINEDSLNNIKESYQNMGMYLYSVLAL